MKGLKTTTISILALGLLAGSAVGVTAQDEGAAGAVEFTAFIGPDERFSKHDCQFVESVKECRGQAQKMFISQVSDPRLDGTMSLSQSRDEYGPRWLVTWTYRIENDAGAWQGSTTSDWYAGDFGAHSVVLVGEGDYDGLTAWMDVTDWSAIRGVVFPGEALDVPEAQTAE